MYQFIQIILKTHPLDERATRHMRCGTLSAKERDLNQIYITNLPSATVIPVTSVRLQKNHNSTMMTASIRIAFAAYVASGLLCTALAAQQTTDFAALVTAVEDGDTITVLHPTAGHTKIRLTDIDAPETRHGRSSPGQPYGRAARAMLSSLVLNKVANISCYAGKTYGRDVCRIRVGGTDAGLHLVRAGLAWAYSANKRYVRDTSVYVAENEARAARRGLWRDETAIPPWVWRKDCWEAKICTIPEEDQ